MEENCFLCTVWQPQDKVHVDESAMDIKHNLKNKPIDWKNSALDWGVGDATTENLPLDGSVVQKYIKDNFGRRAGYFYTDVESSQCYVFSTEADYEKWAADGSENHVDTADLVLGYFEVPSKYAASIKPLDGTEKQYVFTGELNNRIRFE